MHNDALLTILIILLLELGERGLVIISSDGDDTLEFCITEGLLLKFCNFCIGGTIPDDFDNLSLLFMREATVFSLEESISSIVEDIIVEFDELLLLFPQPSEVVLGFITGLVIGPFRLTLRKSGKLVDNFKDFCFDICSVNEGTDCIIGVVGEFCSLIELDDDNWPPECGLCTSG